MGPIAWRRVNAVVQPRFDHWLIWCDRAVVGDLGASTFAGDTGQDAARRAPSAQRARECPDDAARARSRTDEDRGGGRGYLRGGHGLLLIEGPAGIGKTALLACACERAREHGLLTLGGRGSEVEATFPFGVVRQLFAPHLSRMTASVRRLALSGGAAGAGRLLAARLAGNGARAAQEPSTWFAALNSLYMFTANVAAGKPVLLSVDEAHWSDAPSLRFLLYLARRLKSLPVLVALATRQRKPRASSAMSSSIRLGSFSASR